MLNEKKALIALTLTIFCMDTSHAAQAEAILQQAQADQEREALRNRFLQYYRQYREARSRYVATDKLLENTVAQQLHRAANPMAQLAPIFKQICQTLENCSPPVLYILTQTGNLHSDTFTHLKQQCSERLSETLEPHNIIKHIHHLLAANRTFNTFRKLFALDTLDEPQYATEIDFRQLELSAFSLLAHILDDKDTPAPSHALFDDPALRAIAENYPAPTAIPDLRVAVNDYHIFSYMLGMEDIGAPIDSGGRTLLMHFAMKGDLEKIKLLCANSTDNQKKDRTGARAIDYAQKYGHTQIARLLQSQNKKRQQNITILMDCLNTPCQAHPLPQDVISLINDLAHADDELHALGQKFEHAEKLKTQCAERLVTGIIKQLAYQLLVSHLHVASQ